MSSDGEGGGGGAELSTSSADAVSERHGLLHTSTRHHAAAGEDSEAEEETHFTSLARSLRVRRPRSSSSEPSALALQCGGLCCQLLLSVFLFVAGGLLAAFLLQADAARWRPMELRRASGSSALSSFFSSSPHPQPQLQAPSPADLQCDCSVLYAAADALSPCTSVCVFYFYFPQWHATPENNRAHGFAYTDWQLLRGVLADNPGLLQLPDDALLNNDWLQQPGELGYYNLLNREVRRRQGQLAWQYGGRGFIYHFYYFHRQPLMEEFFRLLLLDGQPALPFFLNWANEDWRMDGDFAWRMCHTTHSNRRRLWEWLRPLMRDPRYLRVHNRPVLSVYTWNNSTECQHLWASLRGYAAEEAAVNGFSDLFITRVLAHFKAGDEAAMLSAPSPHFDGVVEFMPNYAADWSERLKAERMLDAGRMHAVHWRGVPANWDNRPRDLWSKKKSGRYDLHPFFFELHLRAVVERTLSEAHAVGVPNLVAVNAWNEWTEGSVMEPSKQLQRRMLEKVQRVTLHDYRGIFAVMLAVDLADVASGHLQALLDVALPALDSALASTPAAPVSCHLDGCLLFDYELLVFARDSPANVSELLDVRWLLLSLGHPRLRFVDTPAVPSDWASSGRPRPPHLISEDAFRAVFRGSQALHSPDWLLLLHDVQQPSSLHALSQLSAASQGQLLPTSPAVAAFTLNGGDSAVTIEVHRFEWVETHWVGVLQQLIDPSIR